MNLEKLAKKHNTDKLWHGYIPHYEKHFKHLKDEPVRLVEIGVASGASLRVWDDWFKHPEAIMLGLEIEPDNPGDISERTKVLTTDGTILAYTGDDLDIVIDDGSHTSTDIMIALGNWWPHLKSGGWYVIEDLAVQWRVDYGGGDAASPAIWYFRDIMDQLLKHDETIITEMHIYNEIIFLRKS